MVTQGMRLRYSDPETGLLASRDVFFDWQGWQRPDESDPTRELPEVTKLLVSATLVNSVNEALTARTAWFRQVHTHLENCRLGFYADLLDFREYVGRLLKVHEALQAHRQTMAAEALKRQQAAAAAEAPPDAPNRGTVVPSERDWQEAVSEEAEEEENEEEASSSSSSSSSEEEEDEEDDDVDSQGEDDETERGSADWTAANEEVVGPEPETVENQTPEQTSPELSAPVEDSEAERGKVQLREVCPVYFYMPDYFLDSYEKHLLGVATETMKAELRRELKEVQRKIGMLGGGSWRAILRLLLKQGHEPQYLTELVMGTLRPEFSEEDAAKQRDTENLLTDGLRDVYDKLMREIEDFRFEKMDSKDRGWQVGKDIFNNQPVIADLLSTLDGLRQQLKPATDDDRKNHIQQLKEKAIKLWEGRSKSGKGEVARLELSLKDWKQRAASLDHEERQRLENWAKELKRKVALAYAKVRKTQAAADDMREQIRKLLEEIEEQKRRIAEQGEKQQQLPPPPPEALSFKRYERELLRYQESIARVKEILAKPLRRISLLRKAMKKMYRKLGKEWDMSDSEEEDPTIPYWKRRQMAEDSLTPFDGPGVLHRENKMQKARRRQQSSALAAEKGQEAMLQMQARKLLGDRILEDDEPLERSLAVGSSPVEPDDLERALQRTRKRLAGFSRRPDWAQDPLELRWRCARLVQLQQMRTMLEAQLRYCAEDFAATLPEGALVRLKLDQLLGKLCMPETNAEDLRLAEEITAELHDAIREAVGLGDEVGPVCLALKHSVAFGDVRQRLCEVWESQRQLKEELSAAIGDWVATWPSSAAKRLKKEESVPSPSQAELGARLASRRVRHRAASPADRTQPLRTAGVGGVGRSVGGKVAARSPSLGSRMEVDFGFRPDGMGEESIENWSLFKVNRLASSGLGAVQGGRLGEKPRHPRAMPDRGGDRSRDFREYVSQARQSEEQSLWKCPSEPSLRTTKKGGTSLPELVNSRSLGNTSPGCRLVESQSCGRLVDRSWKPGAPGALAALAR